MKKTLSKAALGRALGISDSMTSRLVKRGMPLNEAGARKWRTENIDPVRAKFSRFDEHFGQQPEPAPARARKSRQRNDPALRVNKLMAAAGKFLEADAFDENIAETVREAMRAVPIERRSAVLLDAGVMDELLRDWDDLHECDDLAEAVESQKASTMSDDEAALMGKWWYSIACDDDAEFARITAIICDEVNG